MSPTPEATASIYPRLCRSINCPTNTWASAPRSRNKFQIRFTAWSMSERSHNRPCPVDNSSAVSPVQWSHFGIHEPGKFHLPLAPGEVTKRFQASLISAAYTLSKGIGNAEAARLPGAERRPGFQDNNNIRLDRSLNALDNTHRLLLAFTTELPVGKGKKWLNGPAKINALLSGWEVNGLYTFESGNPLLPRHFHEPDQFVRGRLPPENNGTSAALPGPAESRLISGSIQASSASLRHLRSATRGVRCRMSATIA